VGTLVAWSEQVLETELQHGKSKKSELCVNADNDSQKDDYVQGNEDGNQGH